MPKKAAVSVTPEPSEEAGESIIVRRAMMKDTAASSPANKTETTNAGNPIEVKSKKARIEPLAPTTEQPAPAEPAAAAPALDLSAKPATTPKTAEVAAASEKPTDEAKPPTKAPAGTAPTPANGAGEFTLAGADSMDTPDDPSQNPIDQAKAKADKEAAEKQAALDKLITAQTYFLPINSIEKRRTKQLLLVTLLLLVVLTAAGAFWANGQGIISIPGL